MIVVVVSARPSHLSFLSSRKLLLELGCVNVNSSVKQDGPISHGICKEGSLDQQYSCRDLHKLIRKKTSKTEALERLHHRSRIFFVDTVVVFTNFFMAAMYIY
uniref:Uncharacterized protein n=1 Tax=Populus davidiana TaxID=266767 RepID=A0A6M2ENK3_9ROSI